MPITFIDIERRKSWRIAALFALLVCLYFVFALIAVQAVVLFVSPFIILANIKVVMWIFATAFIIAAVHFLSSGYNAVQRVIGQLRVTDPDPEDGIHRQLLNIAEEIKLASGSVKKIRFMVIPTLSLNALAITDLKRDAVIAITEGLLSRLSRPQLEAVIAHEVYHVFSGDCFETSMAASLFGIYASAVDSLKAAVEEDPRATPLFVTFWVLNMLGSIVSMFISREREYRADAGAVRMTRNPIALAEALHLISGRWTGSGAISDGLEMLCISSPTSDIHDNAEGFIDNLLSTHPPVMKRIGILLRMAHASFSVLDRNRDESVIAPASKPLYYALDPENTWVGPFTPEELSTFPWFSPQTWVSTEHDGKAERVLATHLFDGIFNRRLNRTDYEKSHLLCPSCNQPLVKESYLKTSLLRCVFCSGVLIENDRIHRVLARSGQGCEERIVMLIRAVTADNQRSLAIRQKILKDRRAAQPALCPQCRRPMFRSFYSYAFLVELDRCSICRLTWFDRDELDMLQCLVNNKGIINQVTTFD